MLCAQGALENAWCAPFAQLREEVAGSSLATRHVACWSRLGKEINQVRTGSLCICLLNRDLGCAVRTYSVFFSRHKYGMPCAALQLQTS